MKLVNSIVNRNFVEADSILSETVELIMARKLEEAKKMCAAKMNEQGLDASAAELRRKDIVEIDVSKETPEYNSIEDKRATQKPVQTGKGDKQQSIIPKNNLKEDEEQLDEARIKLVKARIRGGKIQRRKKVSNVAGMTIRGGKLQRMSTAERRRRKMGARKAVRKRAPKMNRALMKRKRSLMKRRALGL